MVVARDIRQRRYDEGSTGQIWYFYPLDGHGGAGPVPATPTREVSNPAIGGSPATGEGDRIVQTERDPLPPVNNSQGAQGPGYVGGAEPWT
jgi:hypothetical protein